MSAALHGDGKVVLNGGDDRLQELEEDEQVLFVCVGMWVIECVIGEVLVFMWVNRRGSGSRWDGIRLSRTGTAHPYTTNTEAHT